MCVCVCVCVSLEDFLSSYSDLLNRHTWLLLRFSSNPSGASI